MKPIFSLCVPTRNRVQSIERLLGTLIDTTDNLERIEVLFAHDDDDIISKAYLRRCRKRSPVQIKVFEREQSEWFNEDYYNWLAMRATGEFRWVIGDDLLFIKKGWDTFLINKINEYFKTHDTRILYVRIKDDTPLPEEGIPHYANFPLISEEAIKTVGFFMPREIPSWSGDYLIYLVYCHEKSHRILEIDEQLLQHISSHTQITKEEAGNIHRMLHSKYSVPKRVEEWKETILPLVRGKLLERLQTKRRKPYEPIQLL